MAGDETTKRPSLIGDVDDLLRGEFTRAEDLRRGKLRIPVRRLIRICLILGASYGLFMGLYGGTRPGNPSWLQMLATTVKVPLLFMLTLVVTLPSLYVSSALAGSKLRFADTVRLLLASISIDLALLASLGPVLGFFMFSTQSYPFLVLLNVAFFTVGGVAGVAALRKALAAVFTPEEKDAKTSPRPTDAAEKTAKPSPPALPGAVPGGKENPLPRRDDPDGKDGSFPPLPTPIVRPRSSPPEDARALAVIRVWIFLYCIVGAQMGWILRPFIGSPDLPFQLFRARESNFFAAILEALRALNNS